MKSAKSAKKKVNVESISAALRGVALGAKTANMSKMKNTKSAASSKKQSTKSAKSTKASTALTTKADPEYSKGADYSKSHKGNVESSMKGTKPAAKFKELMNEHKKKKFEGVKNGR